MKKIICPKCGQVAKRTQTKYGIRNYCCNLWSWGNAPLVDKRTHNARKRAHENFDILWKSKLLTRAEAYKWLAKSMNLSGKKCHIKLFDYEKCKRVIRLCRNFHKLM